MKRYLAEMIGTMVLVLMGCGSAVFAGTIQPFASVGTLGVALAFGLSVIAMVYTIGKISGCHINPAITLGMLVSNKISGKDAGMYMLFQVIGAILGSSILYVLAQGSGSTTTLTGANGYSDVLPAFVAENGIYLYFCISGIRIYLERGKYQVCRFGYWSYSGFSTHCMYTNNRDFG